MEGLADGAAEEPCGGPGQGSSVRGGRSLDRVEGWAAGVAGGLDIVVTDGLRVWGLAAERMELLLGS